MKYLGKYGKYHYCCWMLDDAMSRIMSRADRDLGLKYPLPISSPHRSGDNVHIQTKLRFRYSAFSTPNLGDLCPHTQGSEIDTDWLTSGIIWIISVLGPRLGNSVTLRLHNNDLATENISQPSYEIINIPGSRHSGTLELRLCFPSPSHLHSISRNQAVSGIYSMIQHEIGNYFTHHFDRVMIMMEHFPFLWPQ